MGPEYLLAVGSFDFKHYITTQHEITSTYVVLDVWYGGIILGQTGIFCTICSAIIM